MPKLKPLAAPTGSTVDEVEGLLQGRELIEVIDIKLMVQVDDVAD